MVVDNVTAFFNGCSHNKIGVLVEYPLLAFEYAQLLIGNGASGFGHSLQNICTRPKGVILMVENVGFQNTLNISESPLVFSTGQIVLANP